MDSSTEEDGRNLIRTVSSAEEEEEEEEEDVSESHVEYKPRYHLRENPRTPNKLMDQIKIAQTEIFYDLSRPCSPDSAYFLYGVEMGEVLVDGFNKSQQLGKSKSETVSCVESWRSKSLGEDPSKRSNSEKHKKEYVCKKFSKVFESRGGLGGHMKSNTRAHAKTKVSSREAPTKEEHPLIDPNLPATRAKTDVVSREAPIKEERPLIDLNLPAMNREAPIKEERPLIDLNLPASPED